MTFGRTDRAYLETTRPPAQTNPDPDLARAGGEAARRIALFQMHGWEIAGWQPGPMQPAAQRDRYWYWNQVLISGWFDHPYRLRTPAGQTIYVSEPYHIHTEGIENLARIAADGWSVEIMPEKALHFPGRTVAVWIRRPVKAERMAS